MAEQRLVGGIELGGTKTLVAVGFDDGRILASTSLPTVAPEVLVPRIAAFLRVQQAALGPIEALGVGAFGPIVVDRNAPSYGTLLQTNKPGWSDFNLAAALHSAIGLAPEIVTDVAAAGIAEAALGSLRMTQIGIYLTIGTGIGGAIIKAGAELMRSATGGPRRSGRRRMATRRSTRRPAISRGFVPGSAARFPAAR